MSHVLIRSSHSEQLILLCIHMPGFLPSPVRGKNSLLLGQFFKISYQRTLVIQRQVPYCLMSTDV